MSKFRTFILVLYPEIQQGFIDKLLRDYTCAYCLHDKDFDENGEIKKAHYHFIVCFKNPRSITGFAKELGIQANYIECCHDLVGSWQYLIHKNDPDKFQYCIDDVQLRNGFIPPDEERLTDETIFKAFFSELDNFRSFSDMLRWALTNNYYQWYRRNYRIISDIYKESL